MPDRLDAPSSATILVDESPDALFALSLDGRVRSWNRGARTLFGYSHEEAIGESLEALVAPPERIAEFRALIETVLHTGSIAAETIGRRKDGSLVGIDISMRCVVDADRQPLIFLSAKDVTELRRLRQERAADSEASRLKSEFLAYMSHELRTPLNTIIGFANLLHNGSAGSVSAEQREYLGDVLTSSRHLLHVINDVLDLAKVESGTIEFRPEPVDLARLVDEVRVVLRGLAASKRLNVDMSVHPDVATALADPARVRQILYNYLSNAIKFTPEGGDIHVRVVPEGPDLFRLDVEDTGVGIREEDLGKLFIAFQQLDSGTATECQGTGLGLALTRRLAEAQGGRVAVHSTPGRGSTFSAILPRTSASPARDPTAQFQS